MMRDEREELLPTFVILFFI